MIIENEQILNMLILMHYQRRSLGNLPIEMYREHYTAEFLDTRNTDLGRYKRLRREALEWRMDMQARKPHELRQLQVVLACNM